MTALGWLALLILAVLIWLGITALFLVRSMRSLERRVAEMQGGPVFTAAAAAPDDFARLNRAVEELAVQAAALKAAVAQLQAAVEGFKSLSFAPELGSVREGYAGLIEILS